MLSTLLSIPVTFLFEAIKIPQSSPKFNRDPIVQLQWKISDVEIEVEVEEELAKTASSSVEVEASNVSVRPICRVRVPAHPTILALTLPFRTYTSTEADDRYPECVTTSTVTVYIVPTVKRYAGEA
jgi:hypothetical protein